jgi:hypothetical protein
MFAEANVVFEVVPEEKRPSGLVILRSVSNVVGITIAIVLANFSVTEKAESVPYAPMFFAITGIMAGAALLLFFGVKTNDGVRRGGFTPPQGEVNSPLQKEM